MGVVPSQKLECRSIVGQSEQGFKRLHLSAECGSSSLLTFSAAVARHSSHSAALEVGDLGRSLVSPRSRCRQQSTTNICSPVSDSQSGPREHRQRSAGRPVMPKSSHALKLLAWELAPEPVHRHRHRWRELSGAWRGMRDPGVRRRAHWAAIQIRWNRKRVMRLVTFFVLVFLMLGAGRAQAMSCHDYVRANVLQDPDGMDEAKRIIEPLAATGWGAIAGQGPSATSVPSLYLDNVNPAAPAGVPATTGRDVR